MDDYYYYYPLIININRHINIITIINIKNYITIT